MPGGRGERIEPWLDDLSGPADPAAPGSWSHDSRPHGPRRRPPVAGGGRAWWWAAAVVVVLVAALFLLRPVLSDWLWPETRAQQLREQAELALRAGHLTRSDGRLGARELYEAALALEPDRSEALAGLAQVGQAALDQARAAMRDTRYADAHAALALARDLDVPQAQVGALAVELRQREAADAGLGRLLLQAAAARAAGRLDGSDDAALPLYQRVLELQPGQVSALEGREDTLADLLQLARQALVRDHPVEAAQLIRRVQAVDPGHIGLPDVLASLADHVERALQQADDDLRGGRLTRALAGYRQVVEVVPDDPQAARGIQRVAHAHAQRSERLAADFQFDRARDALRQAQSIAPGADAVRQAQRHLDRARRAQARLHSAMPDAERARRVRQLLHEAAAAEARNDLLSPPGESMFDKLRAARAIAPRDPDVIAASARLLQAAQQCFSDALRRNQLTSAGACLNARAVLGDDGDALAASRRRLAQRWIAVGDQRLGAGEIDTARQALQAARAVDPGAPGVQAFADRMATAVVKDD